MKKIDKNGELTQDQRDDFYEGKSILDIDNNDFIKLYSTTLLDFVADDKTLDDLEIYFGTLLTDYYLDYQRIIKATETQQLQHTGTEHARAMQLKKETEAPAGGDSRAQDILAMIRNRQK